MHGHPTPTSSPFTTKKSSSRSKSPRPNTQSNTPSRVVDGGGSITSTTTSTSSSHVVSRHHRVVAIKTGKRSSKPSSSMLRKTVSQVMQDHKQNARNGSSPHPLDADDGDEETALKPGSGKRINDDDITKIRSPEPSNLEGDYLNVALLLLLYFLQGLPMGISATLDLSLQEGGKLSYEEQGIYSSVGWPYSLKMLWAPLVDSVYSRSMGRRKTWLVPAQLCIGLLLYLSADYVDASLGAGGGSVDTANVVVKPDVYALTALFFVFYLLAATQDIAVDGWALEILQKRNLGWASTCNAVGLTAGYAVSFTGLMGLKAYDICDIGAFQKVSGAVFLVTTFLVWRFKKEKPFLSDSEELSVKEAYVSMWRVLSLPSVRLLVLALLTRSVAFAAADSLSSRKLLGAGMKKEAIASMMALLTPLQIVLPGLISKITADRPVHTFISAYPLRFALALLSIATVYLAPDFKQEPSMPLWYWCCLLVLSVFATLVTTTQFVSLMAFFAKVSDPLVGGSYMTTLNTATNLGNKWPNTLVLFAVNLLTWKDRGIDGYYVLNGLCLAVGVLWYAHFSKVMQKLERLPEGAWRVQSTPAADRLS